MVEGSVMTWACMSAPGTKAVMQADDVTHECNSTMNLEIYSNMLYSN